MALVLRKHIAAVLVVVLVLTGHSMAVARGMPGVDGYAEYCLGHSAVMVPVDAEGNPIGPAHFCPDATMTLLAAVTPVTVMPVPVSGMARALEWEVKERQDVIRAVSRSARAPPVGFV